MSIQPIEHAAWQQVGDHTNESKNLNSSPNFSPLDLLYEGVKSAVKTTASDAHLFFAAAEGDRQTEARVAEASALVKAGKFGDVCKMYKEIDKDDEVAAFRFQNALSKETGMNFTFLGPGKAVDVTFDIDCQPNAKDAITTSKTVRIYADGKPERATFNKSGGFLGGPRLETELDAKKTYEELLTKVKGSKAEAKPEPPVEKDKTPAEKEFDAQRKAAKEVWKQLLPVLEKQDSFKVLTDVQKNVAKVLAESIITGSPIFAQTAAMCMEKLTKEQREGVSKCVSALLAPMKIGVDYHENTGTLYIKDKSDRVEKIISVKAPTGLKELEKVEYLETLALMADLQNLSKRMLAQQKKGR
jgi:hypothetical protein